MTHILLAKIGSTISSFVVAQEVKTDADASLKSKYKLLQDTLIQIKTSSVLPCANQDIKDNLSSLKSITENEKYKIKNFYFISVVPEASKIIEKHFQSSYSTINVKSKDFTSHIASNIDDANATGVDRLSAVFATYTQYIKTPSTRINNEEEIIIVDLGTATTIDVIKNSIHLGGIICPGLYTSHKALTNNAAQIEHIKLAPTQKLIGTNTIDAINSWAFFGYMGMLDSIISKIQTQNTASKKRQPIIITGGTANLLMNHLETPFIHDSTLVLRGLMHLVELNYCH